MQKISPVLIAGKHKNQTFYHDPEFSGSFFMLCYKMLQMLDTLMDSVYNRACHPLEITLYKNLEILQGTMRTHGNQVSKDSYKIG